MASSINASTSGAGGVITTADNTGILNLQTGGTTAVTVDASQNVGIGTSSPARQAVIYGSFPCLQLVNSTSGATSNDGLLIFESGLNATLSNQEAGYMSFETSNTERMRIDSSGNVFAGPTATQNGATGVIYSKTTAKAWVTFTGTSATILSSFNVSSVTRSSAGIYIVTFTSAMPNANYSSFYMAQPTVSNAGSDTFTSSPTTTTVLLTHWEAGTNRDSSYSCFVAFGSS